MLSSMRRGIAFVALSVILGTCSNALAAFPFDFDTMENDTDSYTPDPNPAYNPLSPLDPTLGGSPPPNGIYQEKRNLADSRDSVVEEVPSGWSGVTASKGNNFAAAYVYGGFSDGAFVHHSQSIDPIITTLNAAPAPDPNPLLPWNLPQNTWSHQVDMYTDPAIEPTNGANPGNLGSNGVPDVWWTNAVENAFFGGYQTEFGFTPEILGDGTNPKFWRFTTTAGGPFIDLPLGNWYTLETRIVDNRWYGGGGGNDGFFAYYFYIWDQAHQNLLYKHRIDKPNTFQSIEWELIGGPRREWFVYPEANMTRVLIDNLGVAFPTYYGDMNGDGVRDNGDIQPMERALANPGTWAILYPNAAVGNMREQRGDINGDGVFDNFDIQPMEKLLTGNWTVLQGGGNGPETVAVPEPATLVLLASAACVLLVRRRGGRRTA